MNTWMKSSAAAVVAASTAAVAAWGLEGRYTNGDGVTLDFRPDGVLGLSIQPPGDAGASAGISFEAMYAVDADTVMITASADFQNLCGGQPGTYTFVETKESVTFALVEDSCTNRASDLTGDLWLAAPEE